MNDYTSIDTLGSSDFRIQHFTIRELFDRMTDGQLSCLRVEGKKWSADKQILFVESILSGIPVASFYFNGSESHWSVLDGVERSYAIKQYVENRLCLQHLELLSPAYNGYFEDLPSFVRRRFLNTSILGYVLTTQLPRTVLNSIFKRLNNQ